MWMLAYAFLLGGKRRCWLGPDPLLYECLQAKQGKVLLVVHPLSGPKH